MEDLTGQLLIASTIVEDPVYTRGVCLIVHQDDENVIGVMLNRPMQPAAGELLQAIVDDDPNLDTSESNRIFPEASDSLGPIHFGGPLSGPVVAVHPLEQLAEAETGDGVYVAAQKEYLERLVRQQPCPYRLIVGHVSWQPEQLVHEIHSGLWHSIPATVDSVFSVTDQMWAKLARPATTQSLCKWLGVPNQKDMSELN